MKKTISLTGIIAGCSLFLTGCAEMLGDVLFPNYCRTYQVVDTYDNVLWSVEECGGGHADRELECKAKAYDYGNGAKCNCN